MMDAWVLIDSDGDELSRFDDVEDAVRYLGKWTGRGDYDGGDKLLHESEGVRFYVDSSGNRYLIYQQRLKIAESVAQTCDVLARIHDEGAELPPSAYKLLWEQGRSK